MFITLSKNEQRKSPSKRLSWKGQRWEKWLVSPSLYSPVLYFLTFEKYTHITNKMGNIHFIFQNDGEEWSRDCSRLRIPLKQPSPHPIAQRCPQGLHQINGCPKALWLCPSPHTVNHWPLSKGETIKIALPVPD